MQLKWLLSHIRGYLELGMTTEAADEFSKIDEGVHGQTDVLKVALSLYQEEADWPKTRRTAAELCQREPGNAGWWITFAYATRRAENIEAAEEILLTAAKIHPNEPTIVFNLGCYACQRGNLISAKAYVTRAIELDENFAQLVRTDPDLNALRNSGMMAD